MGEQPLTQQPFFTTDDDRWFVGTDSARGPWAPGHCHAGPVAGITARAFERLVPDKQLVRLNIALLRPVPLAGFAIDAEIVKAGRLVTTASATLQDADGKVVGRASSLHTLPRDIGPVVTPNEPPPSFEDATPGSFPIRAAGHDLPSLGDAVSLRYPPGETPDNGPTTLWMKTPPLLPGEEMSPFQRLCPLADCCNGISPNEPIAQTSCLNPDLTIVLHRPPESDWIANRALSRWEPTGIGLATGTLFDLKGPVATATQTLILQR